jgi:hypothetical protein
LAALSGQPCRSVRLAILETEARPAEHRANAGRSTSPAPRGCDAHSTLRPSWHSVIPHDRITAMVSDHWFCPMISDDHRRTMIAHHEAAAIVAAVTRCSSVVCDNENQTGGERGGNSGQCCSTRLHGRAPLRQVRSLRRASSRICERDHSQNISAFAACVRVDRRWTSKSDWRATARLCIWNVSSWHLPEEESMSAQAGSTGRS